MCPTQTRQDAQALTPVFLLNKYLIYPWSVRINNYSEYCIPKWVIVFIFSCARCQCVLVPLPLDLLRSNTDTFMLSVLFQSDRQKEQSSMTETDPSAVEGSGSGPVAPAGSSATCITYKSKQPWHHDRLLENTSLRVLMELFIKNCNSFHSTWAKCEPVVLLAIRPMTMWQWDFAPFSTFLFWIMVTQESNTSEKLSWNSTN